MSLVLISCEYVSKLILFFSFRWLFFMGPFPYPQKKIKLKKNSTYGHSQNKRLHNLPWRPFTRWAISLVAWKFLFIKIARHHFWPWFTPRKSSDLPPPPSPPQIHLLMKAFDTSEPHGMIDGTQKSGSSARPCVLSTIP